MTDNISVNACSFEKLYDDVQSHIRSGEFEKRSSYAWRISKEIKRLKI